MIDEISNQVGHEMYQFLAELYPICRSITGHGVRETLQGIARHIPVKMHEIPSGTEVFDWTVPQEWNIQDAYIKNKKGERIIDFKQSNLHVVSYSQPIHTTMTLEELKPHLYSLPENPDWIPYRTSYYKESWGFCLTPIAVYRHVCQVFVTRSRLSTKMQFRVYARWCLGMLGIRDIKAMVHGQGLTVYGRIIRQ